MDSYISIEQAHKRYATWIQYPTTSRLLSDENLFLDALEVLCASGELADTLGAASQNPEQVCQKAILQLETFGMSSNSNALSEWIDPVLCDFGEFLMLRGILGKRYPLNRHAYSLLKHLLEARHQQQFLQSVLAIKRFCHQMHPCSA